MSRRLVGWVCAMTAGASFIASACGGGETKMPEAATGTPVPSTTPSVRQPAHTPTTGEPAPISIALLGEIARTETAEIIVHGVRSSVSEGDEGLPEGSRWVLLDISLTHTGTTPLPFEAAFFHTDGRAYERGNPPGVGGKFDGDIPPGAIVRGEIAFLVDFADRHGTLVYGLGASIWAIQLSNLPIE